ncbi:MAG: hypothetical protein KIG60_03650 [Caryophanon sp.]|nr:hypothetical protein [Caryophanon sp.]
MWMKEAVGKESFEKQQKKAQKVQKALQDAARTLIESKESLVTALLDSDVDIDIIAQSTKLTKEQVLAIQAKHRGQNDDKH